MLFSLFRLALAAPILLLLTVRASALSVLPPSFPELVAEADTIVQGRVVEVTPHRTTSPTGQPLILTRVTWEITDAAKGSADAQLQLDFLGGRIGEDRLTVTGMPTFKVGETTILFAQRDKPSLCPLVAAGHGCYRVVAASEMRDAVVLRNDGTPLTSPNEVGQPLSHQAAAPLAASTSGLSPTQFLNAVRAQIAASARPNDSVAQ